MLGDPDKGETNVVVTHWPRGSAWPDWCRQFEHDVEAFFNHKFWLVPSRPWSTGVAVPGSNGRLEYSPGFRCGLRITRVPIADAHAIADVSFLTLSSDRPRSFQNQTERIDEFRRVAREALGIGSYTEYHSTPYRVCFGGSGRLSLTNHDLDGNEYQRFSRSTTQRAAIHEIGHLLGLSHVNGAGNGQDAYGTTLHQAGDLMGEGERLEAWHTLPWKRRLKRHLGSGVGIPNWAGTTVRPQVGTTTVDRPFAQANGGSRGSARGGQRRDGGVAPNCPDRGASPPGPRGMCP
jgi:hypothetical protein